MIFLSTKIINQLKNDASSNSIAIFVSDFGDHCHLIIESEYDFTEDTLEEFKGEVSEVAEDDPITEDLFEALQKRGFDPLLILSKTSRLVLESQKVMVKHEKELEEKDKEIDSLKGELQNVNQQLNQHLELINKLTERLSVLEKQGTPVGTLVQPQNENSIQFH